MAKRRMLSRREADEALAEYVDTTGFITAEGEPFEPTVIPPAEPADDDDDLTADR